eukprot:683742-Prorocentrum_minimum.AAC.1
MTEKERLAASLFGGGGFGGGGGTASSAAATRAAKPKEARPAPAPVKAPPRGVADGPPHGPGVPDGWGRQVSRPGPLRAALTSTSLNSTD